MKSSQNINNNSENEDEHIGAFQRVAAKVKPTDNGIDNMDSGLRRSTRPKHNRSNKTAFKKSANFQQSESIDGNSINDSRDAEGELNDENDVQPLK
jgi:hypothetical protein